MEAPRIHRKPVSMHNLAQASAQSAQSAQPGQPAQPAQPAPRRQQSSYTLRGDAGPLRGYGYTAADPPPPAYTPYAASAPPTPTFEHAPPPPLPARPPVVGQFAPGITSRPGPGPVASATAPVQCTPQPAVAAAADGKPKDTFWKTALDETFFFASGLVQKPYESTKHYTILRHSAGLVMYRGPATSVVVTLFASPDHRVSSSSPLGQRCCSVSVWLQRRGYSGDTGLRLKTLVGANSSWLDVTPERPAAASELPTADERGYQRDIQKFMKKTVPGSKHYDKSVAGRVPCETLVVRIPAACADGYFRLIVCSRNQGGSMPDNGTHRKKVLCGSPVFRVASMSTDASILRGASLTTLPLEAGVMVASMLGARYVAGAAAPVIEAAQAQVSKYQPGLVTTLAAQTAFENSRLASNDDDDEDDDEARNDEATRVAAYRAPVADEKEEEDVPPEVVGDDRGPSPPFPVQFQGRVVPGSGHNTRGVPTANLAGVPDDLRLRLRGVYFGWAAVTPPSKKGTTDAGIAPPLPRGWIEAIVTVAPPPQPSKAAVVQRNEVAAHLLYDLGGASLIDATVRLIVMAPLSARTDIALSGEASSLVVASLSRPAWGAQATLARIEAQRSERSSSQAASERRGIVQKQVDRIPFHWAGVRTAGGEMRDQLYGNGGFWVAR